VTAAAQGMTHRDASRAFLQALLQLRVIGGAYGDADPCALLSYQIPIFFIRRSSRKLFVSFPSNGP